jgi:hypothetical protein
MKVCIVSLNIAPYFDPSGRVRGNTEFQPDNQLAED